MDDCMICRMIVTPIRSFKLESLPLNFFLSKAKSARNPTIQAVVASNGYESTWIEEIYSWTCAKDYKFAEITKMFLNVIAAHGPSRFKTQHMTSCWINVYKELGPHLRACLLP